MKTNGASCRAFRAARATRRASLPNEALFAPVSEWPHSLICLENLFLLRGAMWKTWWRGLAQRNSSVCGIMRARVLSIRQRHTHTHTHLASNEPLTNTHASAQNSPTALYAASYLRTFKDSLRWPRNVHRRSSSSCSTTCSLASTAWPR